MILKILWISKNDNKIYYAKMILWKITFMDQKANTEIKILDFSLKENEYHESYKNSKKGTYILWGNTGNISLKFIP